MQNKNLIIKLTDRILLLNVASISVLVFLAIFFFSESIPVLIVIFSISYASTFVLTYLIGRNFSKRLTRLTYKLEEMAAGIIPKKIESAHKDEIGSLINTINLLIHRIRKGIVEDVSRNKEIVQAKTDFVTIASHQLRTPLSIIKWHADYLLSGDSGELGGEQRRYIKEIYQSNERSISLVNALLDVSRIDLGTFSILPEKVDIIEIIKKVLESFSEEIRIRKIDVENRYEEIPMLRLDPSLTKMVFENLIHNAIVYNKFKGRIKIQVKKIKNDVMISVSDTGCGIPKDQQPKVYTKLFRADNAKKIVPVGTGLGLYIVKAIVERSGGKVWYESPNLNFVIESEQKGYNVSTDKNMGTTFYVKFPLKGARKKQGTKRLISSVK